MFGKKDCSNGHHSFETIKVINNSECPIKLLKCKICKKEFWLFNDKWLHEKSDMPVTLDEAELLSKV